MRDSLFLIADELARSVNGLRFRPPVAYVYNPLDYARVPHRQYLERYVVGPPGRTLLLGMNPGPWGMAQTGVPFGEVELVKRWLGIEGEVERPDPEHPKRPVTGFACPRSEVSGRRLWGLFQDRFSSAQEFQKRFVVLNYCPLLFMEEGGRNRTPDRLPKEERESLFHACDLALTQHLELLEIDRAVGVGRFATDRLVANIAPGSLPIASIAHPSPANPKANRGWAKLAEPLFQSP